MKEVKVTLVFLSKGKRQVNRWRGKENPRWVILGESPDMIHTQGASESAVRRQMYLCPQNIEEKQNQWKFRRLNPEKAGPFN